MIVERIDPPKTRRKFIHEWDEIGYLYWKGAYWIHIRQSRLQATRFIERLKTLIDLHDPNEEALLGAMGQALFAEFHRDLVGEIKYTERVVRMVVKCIEIMPDPDYDWEDVRNKMEILACLYSENGQNGKALRLAKRIGVLCRKHSVSFDETALRKTILS